MAHPDRNPENDPHLHTRMSSSSAMPPPLHDRAGLNSMTVYSISDGAAAFASIQQT
jgi:hypothetical protein